MSPTRTIRLAEKLVDWLKERLRPRGAAAGRLIRQQLEAARSTERDSDSFVMPAQSAEGLRMPPRARDSLARERGRGCGFDHAAPRHDLVAFGPDLSPTI